MDGSSSTETQSLLAGVRDTSPSASAKSLSSDHDGDFRAQRDEIELVPLELERQSRSSTQSSEEQETQVLLSSIEPRFATRENLRRWIPEAEWEDGNDAATPSKEEWLTWSLKKKAVTTVKRFLSRDGLFSRHGLLCCASAVAVIICLINLVGLITALLYTEDRVIYTGDCTATNRVNSLIHVALNFLGSLLLSASNLCMQLVVAPTRAEIDKAHGEKKWLDIGMLNFKNLRHIEVKRRFIWALLALTSLPIHFFYNSVFYDTLPINSVIWGVVSPNFLDNGPININITNDIVARRANISVSGVRQHSDGKLVNHNLGARLRRFYQKNDTFITFQNDIRSFTKMNTSECLTLYTKGSGDRSDLIMVSSSDLVTSNPIPDNSSLLVFEQSGGIPSTGLYDWQCGFSNSFDCRRPEKWESDPTVIERWNVFGYKIDYCLSQQRDLSKACSVQYLPPLWIVVCAMNICKCFLIIYTTCILFKNRVLTTVGDVAASFLAKEDSTTKGIALASRETIAGMWNAPKVESVPWKPSSRWWFHAASKRKWFITISSCMVIITAGCIFLGFAISAVRAQTGSSTAWKDLGFGKPSEYTMVRSVPGIAASESRVFLGLLFTNWWQVAISIVYIQYNSLLSSLLVSEEWSHFFSERKALRVSSAKGLQRSSTFVSMPLRYGVPLIATTSLLHWLVSQSVFLLVIESYFSNGEKDPDTTFPIVGCSIGPIISAIVVGSLYVIVIALLGLRKYPAGIPLASTCSAAISAACHPPAGDDQAHHFPVTWGVVDRCGGVNHCSLTTAWDVEKPELGSSCQ